MSDMVHVRELRLVIKELRAEVERLQKLVNLRTVAEAWGKDEIEHLRAQNTEAAAFLDGLADHQLKLIVPDCGDWFDKSAAECRAMAAKLREGK